MRPSGLGTDRKGFTGRSGHIARRIKQFTHLAKHLFLGQRPAAHGVSVQQAGLLRLLQGLHLGIDLTGLLRRRPHRISLSGAAGQH